MVFLGSFFDVSSTYFLVHDLDNAEDVVYTGQGGHNLTGDKRQIKDQVLERGNLALKVCASKLFGFPFFGKFLSLLY